MGKPVTTQEHSQSGREERAILLGLRRPREPRWVAEESLEELARLTETAGAKVVATLLQERRAPSPALYFGKGKVEEVALLAKAQEANLAISDEELTPVQERNLQRALRVKVIDRTALILDIFAQRARTSEGKLQVELAQLQYLLPRLVGQWRHLERLGGGIGTRGPGETQLETDRRLIRRRIQRITADLREVSVHRRLLRDHRKGLGLPVVALVGYTNAGKTTLLNRLAGAAFPTADQFFVTLDPAARLVEADGTRFILTDTVGFIRKLPTELIAAFKATLEELNEADLLVHVVDASHPRAREHMAAVEQLLSKLGVAETPVVVALNKLDRVEGPLPRLLDGERGAGVSARTGVGTGRLLEMIRGALRPRWAFLRLHLPHDQRGLLALIYERGRVLRREDRPEGILVEVEVPRPLAGRCSEFRIPLLREPRRVTASRT